MYRAVMPITDAVFEMGEFDTQVLAAVEAGQPLPQGTDYQHGPRYGYNTLRAAVLRETGIPVRYVASLLIKALSFECTTLGSAAVTIQTEWAIF